MVFDLHNFDIISELKKLNYKIEKDTSSNIKSIDEIIGQKEEDIKQVDISAIDEIDFSQIPDLKEDLLTLLPPKPLFLVEHDFKKILEDAYQTISKDITTNIENILQKKETLFHPEEYRKLSIVLNNELGIKKGELISQKHLISFNKQTGIELLINYLEQINLKKIEDYPSKIIALYIIYRFCIKLLQKGAYIPELVKIETDKFIIRWLPALINEDIKNIFDKIKNITPNNLLELEQQKVEPEKLSKKRNKKQEKPDEKQRNAIFISQENQVLLLCSALITEFIKLIYKKHYEYNRINLLFFNGNSLKVEKFEDREIPNTINLWLSRFYIVHKDFVPIIKINEIPSGFSAEILVENKQNPLAPMIKLTDVMEKSNYSAIKADILKSLTLLSEHFKQISQIISSKGRKKLTIGYKEFVDVFFKSLPVIKLLAIPVLLPKGLKELVKPGISLSLSKKKGTQTVSYLSLDKILDFNWQIALGDKLLSISEFIKLVKGMSGIVKIKDQYIYLNEAEIQKIISQSEKTPKLSSNDLLQIILTEEYADAKISFSKEIRSLLQSFNKTESITLPTGLLGTLREYQKRGYEWMMKNSNFGFGSIIADDMGLGKTFQVITVLLKLKQEQKIGKEKVLVIAPTTLLTNWNKEIQKFAPDLKTFIYHGQKRELELEDTDIVLTTYGIVRRENKKFQEHIWKIVVIDEAQNIKNHEAGHKN